MSKRTRRVLGALHLAAAAAFAIAATQQDGASVARSFDWLLYACGLNVGLGFSKLIWPGR